MIAQIITPGVPQASAPPMRSTREITVDTLLRTLYPEHFGILHHRTTYWDGSILCNNCEYTN